MRTNIVLGLIACSLIASWEESSFSQSDRSRTAPQIKLVVERVERPSQNEVRFQLRIISNSEKPVFLEGQNFGKPFPDPVFLEQWRGKEGWHIVAPCPDVPPPDVIKLKPASEMTLERVLTIPINAPCKERSIRLEGRFRFSVDYFESEKEAHRYISQFFSPRQPAEKALSETFEIPQLKQ